MTTPSATAAESNNQPAPERESSRRCPDCGYDLRHLSSERCPECGWVIESTGPIAPVPWEHRRRLGRWRAFWRTARLATFSPRRLVGGEETLDYVSARRFRWLVIIIASFPLGILLTALRLHEDWSAIMPPPPVLSSANQFPAYTYSAWEAMTLWLAGTRLPLVGPLGVLVTLALATAAPALGCRPRFLPVEAQNRAVARVAYGCGALVWLWIPKACGAAALLLGDDATGQKLAAQCVLALLAAISLLAILVSWGWATQTLWLRSTRRGFIRKLIGGMLLPVLWVASALAGLLVLPMVIGLLALMIDSVR